MHTPITQRCFFAFTLPIEIREKIISNVAQLKQQKLLTNSYWVIPEKWHITSRFLGNVTQEQQQLLIAQVTALAENIAPITITIDKLELFPSVEQQRIIALIPKPKDQLIAISHAIEKIVIKCGLAAETHGFLPHITLCRLKQTALKNLDKIQLPKIQSMQFTANSLHLLRSIPQSNYQEIAAIKLQSHLLI